MEPIFSSPDIIKQMPEEGSKFQKVDKTWKDLISKTHDNPKVMNVIEINNLLQNLQKCTQHLEYIQKVINIIFEAKR